MTIKHYSEAGNSELLENLREMFPLYYMDSDVISRFKSSSHKNHMAFLCDQSSR